MTAAIGATYSYYDPAVGRFLSRDPVPYLQRYAYVGNNPANLVETGREAFCPDGCRRT